MKTKEEIQKMSEEEGQRNFLLDLDELIRETPMEDDTITTVITKTEEKIYKNRKVVAIKKKGE